jgi:carbamoyl-phosphate synthase large subunit
MTPAISILVTGVAGGTIGEQAVKALRCGLLPYRIVGTNVTPTHVRAGFVEAWETLPPAEDPAYPGSVSKLIRKHGIQFVIPGSEPELLRLARDRSSLEAEGARLLANSLEIIGTCTDKGKTFRTLSALGVRIPATFEIQDLSDVSRIPSLYPFVVKPAHGGGSAAVFLAQTEEELRFFVEYHLRYGWRSVVQEYVGAATDEYTVGVLHFPNGACAGTVVMHRQILSGLSHRFRVPNRTGRRELGETLAISSGISQGEIGDFPEIRKTAEAIAGGLGSVGPMNLQGRWDGRQFVPFEINPRFSATSSMRAMAGFNEPEILINWHLTGGREMRAPEVRKGTFERGLVEYFSEAGRK